jgi:hypothetical protein
MTKNKKNIAPKAGKPSIAPKGKKPTTAPEAVEQEIVADTAASDRDSLIAKAKAARQAAAVGLISQEEADAHWATPARF